MVFNLVLLIKDNYCQEETTEWLQLVIIISINLGIGNRNNDFEMK